MEASIQQISSMLQQRPNISEKDLKRYTTDIQDKIHNTIADLDELDDTIKIVQGNPARFKIEKREIDDRKAFVNTTRRLVEVIMFLLGYEIEITTWKSGKETTVPTTRATEKSASN